MAKAIAGKYTGYQFEGDEEQVAQTFHHLQKMFLQNLRLESQVTKDGLIPDFDCPQDYFYRKAQLDGQIQVLSYLIELEVKDANQTTDA